MTVLPGASGASSASRSQWNACLTSVSQLTAERLPRVVLQRTRQRGGAGVEHENAGPVGVDELPGHGGVGRVGAHRGEGLAEFGAQFFQRGAVAGDPDDRGAGPVERGGDSPAEPPAGPGDQRGRALNVIAWHNDSPGVLEFLPPVV